MSLCRLSFGGAIDPFDVRVTDFESPLTGTMASAQTKEQIHHYPIRADQQSLRMSLVFRSTEEWSRFQDFVRASHMWAVRTVENPEVTIYWPERGMVNWTGLITALRAGDQRFNHAPKAQIEFLLVDSMLSQKTWSSSFGDEFRKFFETDIGDPRPGEWVPPPASTDNGGVLDGSGPGGIDLTDPFGMNNGRR